MILSPESKSQWLLQKVLKAGEYGRGTCSVCNDRSWPSKVGMRERLGRHVPHTVSCSKESCLLSRNLPAQFFWFFSDSYPQDTAITCQFVLYLLRVIILPSATSSVVLGRGSISAAGKKRINLSILRKIAKPLLVHILYFSCEISFNGEKAIFKRRNSDVS